MILLTGGTGTVGSEVARQLHARGARFRVLTRDPERARRRLGNDVEAVAGDLDDPDSLGPAFEEVGTLFLLTAADPRQVEQQGRCVDTALAAGVERIVKLSGLGADDDSPVSFGRWHAQTEQQIAETSLEYTILRPHYFMQNILGFAADIATTGALHVPMKDGRIGLVDARDVAAVAVQALTASGHAGKTYDITGPEALSFASLADILTAELGRPVAYVDVPPNEAEKAMVGTGMPDWLADAMLGLYGIFGAGHASECTRVVEEVTGRPARSFREFVADHRDQFLAPA